VEEKEKCVGCDRDLVVGEGRYYGEIDGRSGAVCVDCMDKKRKDEAGETG
jgi:hypothetical protein